MKNYSFGRDRFPGKKKTFFHSLIIMAVMLTVTASCEDAMVDVTTYSSIEGVVLDDSTYTAIVGASITTSPATEAIITDSEGAFRIEDIPTDVYTINVRKRGYERSSVTVSVREGRTNIAEIVMSPETKNESEESQLHAEVTNWWNTVEEDIVMVNVEYRLENTGTAAISSYEVTFQIESSRGEYFHQESGTNLSADQIRTGSFEIQIPEEEADTVEIYNIWTEKS